MKNITCKRSVVVALVCALSALWAAPASANAAVYRVSTSDPIAACNPVNDLVGLRGYEHQASLEVDPKDNTHLVAVWTQDFDDGTALASSHDGGATWTVVGVPGQTPGCGGDTENLTFDSAQNPRAAVGPDGAVYVISNISSSKSNFEAVRVNVTRDDGATWSGSKTLASGVVPALDWVWVTADPTRPGVATVLWDERTSDATGVVTSASEHFSRTTTWGGSWTRLADPAAPPDGATFQFGQLHTLPDHTLVDVFAQCTPETSPLWTQLPEGQCTSASPIRVRRFVGGEWSGPLAGPTVGSWFDAQVTNRGEILVASVVGAEVDLWRSPDLGVTWDAKRTVTAEGVNMDAAVTETAQGAIAVAYYHSQTADDPTGVLALATSRDGAPWARSELAGPFDVYGPTAGKRMGEWLGLRAIGSVIDCVFVAGVPSAEPTSAVTGPTTDVFLATASRENR